MTQPLKFLAVYERVEIVGEFDQLLGVGP